MHQGVPQWIPRAGGPQIYTTPICKMMISCHSGPGGQRAPELLGPQMAGIPGAWVSQNHTTPIQHRFVKWRFLAIQAPEARGPRSPSGRRGPGSQEPGSRKTTQHRFNTDLQNDISWRSGSRGPDPELWIGFWAAVVHESWFTLTQNANPPSKR